MKKSKVLLLSLGMALCVGGGVGAAVAITRNAAGNTGSGVFDKVISLYWSEGVSTASLTDMEELTVDVPQYRYLEVTPESSKTVAGTVSVNFKLTAADSTKDIKGINISVYALDSALSDPDDAAIAGAIGSKTAALAINSSSTEGTTTFSVAVNEKEGFHKTNAYYGIKVVYDGSQQASGKTLGGILTMTQSFAA